MNRYVDKRHARRTSLLLIRIVLLSFAVATVLTYTILTNENKDGTIGSNVTSGKCRVDIVDVSDSSLVGDVLDFQAPSGKENIYFEPGAVFYTEAFAVKNIGNIPIKFRIYISENEDVDMQAFEQAFELWITTNPQAPLASEKLTSFAGELNVGETSERYYLLIAMKKDAGNEFQNKTYTGIGITVYAVQSDADIES